MRAVILIHGFLTNELDFKSIDQDLKKNYDKVVYYIAPGHQTPPNYKEFNVDKTFKTLLECYDNVADEGYDIDVIGFSMGGALATYLQSVRKVNKLVLLAPANKYLNFKLLDSRLKFYKQVRNDKDLMKMLAQNDKISMQMAFKQLFPNYNVHNLKTFREIVKRCNKELISITEPVLIIWGKLDQLVPYTSCRHLYDLTINEHKRLVVLDDISHLMLNSTNNEEIIKLILDFIKE